VRVETDDEFTSGVLNGEFTRCEETREVLTDYFYGAFSDVTRRDVFKDTLVDLRVGVISDDDLTLAWIQGAKLLYARPYRDEKHRSVVAISYDNRN
jgi:hypothetical protein